MSETCMISFAITVKDEADYISNLLEQIVPYCEQTGDEVVVLDDYSTDEKTISILNSYHNNESILLYQRNLNNDFAAHKNYLNEMCNGDYIFQIDADETLHPNLLNYLHDIIEHNYETDLFMVPRTNIVHGITEEDIAKWGWWTNELGWICPPDYQTRIYRNSSHIRWEGRVHERIVGHKTQALLPPEEEWSIYHIKDITRQRSQNQLYATINR